MVNGTNGRRYKHCMTTVAIEESGEDGKLRHDVCNVAMGKRIQKESINKKKLCEKINLCPYMYNKYQFWSILMTH